MSIRKLLAVFVIVLMAVAAYGQDRQEQPSKVDIFAGYAYYAPGGRLAGAPIKAISTGFGVATTYWLNKNFGVNVDGGGHFGGSRDASTIFAGPSVRIPLSGITPFGTFGVGLHRLGLSGAGSDNGLGLGIGGGLDLHVVPRLSFRLIEADYIYAHHNFGPFGRVNNSGQRIRSGLVWQFGSIGPPPAPPSASCSASPSEVFEGENVTANVSAANFNPKRTLTYTWSSNGGKIDGKGSSANVDTKGLQPGSYTVKANVSDGKKGSADCTAGFAVKAPRPPQISCSASPSNVLVGDSSTITASASSPDGRPLTYGYTASAGSISGNGPTASLSTQGASAGRINVDCTATDDRNLSASASTSVNATNPPPPPKKEEPKASWLNQLDFKKNSARVDNKAKAILDDVALRLQRDPNATVAIVGNQAASEKAKGLAGQRALNAKTYLVKEKGIDPARVSTWSGTKDAQTADIWWVPAGATPDTSGMTEVKEAAKKAAAKKK